MGKKTCSIIAIIFSVSITAFSQDSVRVGTKLVPIPELSFNSDFGIKVAGEVHVYNYGYDYKQPFEQFSRYRLSYSTIGAFSAHAIKEKIDAFGANTRLQLSGFISRNLSDYYLGDTDSRDYDESRFDDNNYYHYKMVRADFKALVRSPFKSLDRIEKAQLKYAINLVYERPFELDVMNFLSQNRELGRKGSLLAIAETGVIIDQRNSEFRPHRGFLFDLSIKGSIPVLSTFNNLQNHITFLGFVPIYDRLFTTTLATRINLVNSIGDTPYWYTPSLGGVETLRGFIFRRFSSDNALSYTAELRSWVFSLPYKNIELGGHVFVDGGRVFNNKNWDSLLVEHKTALGLGGVMSIFTPDFILKAEIGFSEDGTGVYIGTGYSF